MGTKAARPAMRAQMTSVAAKRTMSRMLKNFPHAARSLPAHPCRRHHDGARG